MRIVMIGPFGLRPRGTMAVRALPMARALAARGHQVTVLLPAWQNPEDAGQGWETEGVTVENIPLPPRVPLIFHLWTARRLVARALSLRPDVIHLFKPKAYSGLAHRLLALRPRALRPRLVVDSDDWEGPGGWNDVIDPVSGRAIYSPFQRWFFAHQERWGLTHADAVTVASRTLQSLVWALGVPPDRVIYVPNGWPSSDDIPPSVLTDSGNSSGLDILLYTRFFEFSLCRVIRLLRRVRELVPHARLLVVGKGLFGEEDRLRALAREARLEDGVEYAGWVEPHRLGEVFARSALAIYPFDDTLINRTKCPVKLLDLLGAGVPVVAEAVGEIGEMIRPGETGWLVPPGDEDAFVGAVVHLLEDPDLRRRMERQAAQDVRSRYNWGRLVVGVERAYGWGE